MKPGSYPVISSGLNSFSDTLHACVGGWTKLIKLKLFSFLDNFLKDISGFVGDEDQAKATCLAGCVLSF